MSKFICQFVIFFIFCYIFCNNISDLMKKDIKMALIIKNAETLFERFENSMEVWAQKIF
jgi:hypothetical protein